MDLWDISKDIFDSLIQDISAKAAVTEEEEENVTTDHENILKVLPPELLGHIFQFLTQSELYPVRLVCKGFNEVASSPHVLKLYLKDSYLDFKELDLEVARPLLKNIISVNIYNTRFEDTDILEKLFKKLEEEFTSLKIFKISYGYVPDTITIENIVEKLEEILLMSVEFKNAPYFFKTSPENPVYRNLEKFEMFNCTGIEAEVPPFEGLSVAPMKKLREICLSDVQTIGDREYLHLKQSMTNVTALVLSNTTLNVETFLQLDLRKVKNLNVSQCQSSSDWLSALKNLHELDTLHMSAVSITDTCSMGTFKKLSNIKALTMTDCNFGNRTVGAVVGYLPNLVTLEMMPSEDGNVTDMALNNFVVHNQLETIMFDRVQFGGFSLRQIGHCAPALKSLALTICAAGDDDMDVFKDCFTQLKKLNVSGLRITDIGLGKLQPRLGSLEEIIIESRFVTGSGMASILHLLTSVTFLDFKFGEPQSWFSYSRCTDDSYNQLSITGPGITREILMSITKELYDAIVLRFESIILDIEIMKHFVETQLRTNNLTINTCTLDDDMMAIIIRDFKNLNVLYIYQCRVTMNGFVKLFEGIGDREINLINIENENMFDEETLVAVVPYLPTITDLNVHNINYEEYLSITNNPHAKDLIFQGITHLSDETFVTIIKSYDGITNLTLSDTSVTVSGITEVAEHLTNLTYFRIKSKVIGDTTMEVIGKHFPNLKSLSVESEVVTDVGLLALEKHFETLESLILTDSEITDEGIKKIAPLLKATISLDLYSRNKKVTAELFAYMRETYPDISHIEPEIQDLFAEGGENVEGEAAEEQVQPPEENGNEVAAADAVQLEAQNEVVVQVVQLEDGNGVDQPVEPIQAEVVVVDNPVQPEEQHDVAENQVQHEEVPLEPPSPPPQSEQNEVETERQTPKEQNRVAEEQEQAEKKNMENNERRSSESENVENDVVMELPPPPPSGEAQNGFQTAPQHSEEEKSKMDVDEDL